LSDPGALYLPSLLEGGQTLSGGVFLKITTVADLAIPPVVIQAFMAKEACTKVTDVGRELPWRMDPFPMEDISLGCRDQH